MHINITGGAGGKLSDSDPQHDFFHKILLTTK